MEQGVTEQEFWEAFQGLDEKGQVKFMVRCYCTLHPDVVRATVLEAGILESVEA